MKLYKAISCFFEKKNTFIFPQCVITKWHVSVSVYVNHDNFIFLYKFGWLTFLNIIERFRLCFCSWSLKRIFMKSDRKSVSCTVIRERCAGRSVFVRRSVNFRFGSVAERRSVRSSSFMEEPWSLTGERRPPGDFYRGETPKLHQFTAVNGLRLPERLSVSYRQFNSCRKWRSETLFLLNF